MYFYIPNHRYGNDKVALIQWEDFNVWAIYEIDGERAVCVWDEVAFSELVKPYRRDWSQPDSMHCVFEDVLSPRSLELIHRFVNHWFTTYYKALPLWLGDIDQLIKRKKKWRKKKWGTWSMIIETRVHNIELREHASDGMPSHSSSIESEYVVENKEIWLERLKYDESILLSGQTLIIFPTVRSLHQHLQWWLMGLTWSVILHGQLHASARAKAFWDIKSWAVHTVYATYSQVFRDWNDLKKVIMIDQHARWYKNFQEPRYFAPTVIDYMEKIWWCETTKTGELVEW